MGRAPWRDRDFLKLWFGQTVSSLGTQVTDIALPTAAIKLLGAGTFEVGLLEMMQYLAFPVLGLVAGVWVDRLSRRPVMIAGDVLRLIALASIPIAWFTGALTIWHLYATALVVGVATVFFVTAYQAYLPSLLARTQLIRANALVEGSYRAAQVLGPGIGGLLIQALQAAAAILADSVSYAVSIVSLLWINASEPARPAITERPGFMRELVLGLRGLLGHSHLRLMAAAVAIANLGSQMLLTVFFVYVYNHVRLTPGQVGGILSAGGAGAVLGAAVAPGLARRIGLGPAVTVSLATLALFVLVPAAGSSGFPVLGLAIVFFAVWFGGAAYNVNSVSYRQAVVPLRLQGRIVATTRTVTAGTVPIGALLGGILGSRVGLVPALYAGAGVAAISIVPLLAGPVRIRELPTPPD